MIQENVNLKLFFVSNAQPNIFTMSITQLFRSSKHKIKLETNSFLSDQEEDKIFPTGVHRIDDNFCLQSCQDLEAYFQKFLQNRERL